jgi:peptide/nickel transport system ATP-binding protein
VLEIEGLDIVYDTEHGPLHAVRDASLTICEHESFGLVGESGSGKSTLAMGAIRYLAANGRIADGSVKLNGKELAGLSRHEMRGLWGSQIGVVYQSPLSALNPSYRIGRQIAEVAQLHMGMDKVRSRDRAVEMLTKVAMPDPESVMERYPHQLSGGMLQRCVIAMALMTNPSLLIMDEPTTALDVTTQAVVLDLVWDLKREFDSAILYITHDLGVVAKICERIGVLYAGEFMEQGELRELFHTPLHPYTLNLLGCVPHFEFGDAKRSLVCIPGFIPRIDELPPGCVFAPRCEWAEEACVAKRPPLVEVLDGHLSACRRWNVVPPIADHSFAATSELAPRGRASVDDRLIEATDVHMIFTAPGGGLLGRGERPKVRAVDGMTLWLDKGRTLGIVGESGSGKTTMARTIIGLEEATSGTITLRGEPLARSLTQRPDDVLKEIQMVFQNPDASLNPHTSVAEAIGRPLKLLTDMTGEQVQRRVLELLDAVQLPASYYYRMPGELSGGEKQRVAIARAFAADPAVILCDEPISSLDVSVQGALMNLLMSLQAEKQVSYLFISHDLSAVQHLSDSIAVVYLGHMMEWGDATKVLTPPFHPYTEALLSAVPVADPDVQQASIRLQGSVPSAMNVPPGCRFHPRCPRCLGDICREQEPPWREDEGDHWIYCHIPLSDLREMEAGTIEFSPARGGD